MHKLFFLNKNLELHIQTDVAKHLELYTAFQCTCQDKKSFANVDTQINEIKLVIV